MEQKEISCDLFQNGSTWLRADFHLHTIKDKEFSHLENPNDFFKLFISRLKEEDINIGVITNHNKFDKEEFCNLRKKAKKENIWIVPGVELSVKDGANGIHVLIVFDESKWITSNEDYINQFLTTAFEGIQNREHENTPCNYSVDALLKKLNDHKTNGRDSFAILAHVNQKSGFFNEFDGGRIKQFGKNELFQNFVLAFQKVRNHDDIEKCREWFVKPLPAFVEGSDCKCIEEVGKSSVQKEKQKKTYVKLGGFNFEALKYALLDAEYRLREEKPEIKNSYIKSIKFEGEKLADVHIDLSPELNNFIGIRGSGKSSILEIIRYTLGIPHSSVAVDAKYKGDLIAYILGSGGKSIVTIVDKNREEYQIEKIYGQKEDIKKDGSICHGITVDSIFDYPVYFGQKDLSNKDADFESDLIQRLVGIKLKATQSKIDSKKREIEHIFLELEKLKNLNELKVETDIVINNSQQQLNYFKEKGIEDKLRQQTQFDADISRINQTKEIATSFVEEVYAIIESYDHFFSSKIISSDLNKEIFEDLTKCLSKLNDEFIKLKQIYVNSFTVLGKVNDVPISLVQKKEGLKEEFAQIKRELNGGAINPDDFLKLNRIIETSKLKIIEINKSEKKREDLIKVRSEKLVELNSLWLEKFRLLEKEIQKINEADNQLKIEIEFKGKKNKFKDTLVQFFKGTNIRESSYQRIVNAYADFIEILKDRGNLKSILNENQYVDFMNRFQENIKDLLTYKVEDNITINYNGKPLEQHSLGQRASALILFLLAQKDNDVLIIDQPEDDLDNQTIYGEVIKELRRLKGNMQFIFATHNANIPVLGDSEKIFSCTFGDKIEIVSGNIDSPQIQKSIVEIMEGGNEAFTRRKNIYSLWNV